MVVAVVAVDVVAKRYFHSNYLCHPIQLICFISINIEQLFLPVVVVMTMALVMFGAVVVVMIIPVVVI